VTHSVLRVTATKCTFGFDLMVFHRTDRPCKLPAMSSPVYDELWRKTWGDMQTFGPVHRHVREDLVRVVSKLGGTSVLDVGCGSGENLAALAFSGNYQLAGVDISAKAIELAERRVPTARLKVLDVEREALDERFDIVISIQAVEHLLDDMAGFRNIARMAKRYVFISTMAGRMRSSELGWGHFRNYSVVELRRKLEAVGLVVSRVYGWGFPFYSPIYRSVVEWLPGGPPEGPAGQASRLGARALYHLYRLNWPGRGDVLSALAAVPAN
jgi:2-polyprenyl-3-methyl-5-hydroxy-6-metoxy-1,4-benzoquinol methylase